jgi:hypothetical protein
MISLLSTWRHSGFHVFCGNRSQNKGDKTMENLARYIIRASFSQERMQYLADEGTVICWAKDGKDRKVFDHVIACPKLGRNKWFDTTIGIAMSHRGNGGRKVLVFHYYKRHSLVLVNATFCTVVGGVKVCRMSYFH